ncbi:MAG TPA: HEXXH motif-containing putative peptide modification protein [Steroidobacteraceae bacterium]|nr:HEXXH motif-containing putative peptide modification protein [Steroidobacteraceae bacterium]
MSSSTESRKDEATILVGNKSTTVERLPSSYQARFQDLRISVASEVDTDAIHQAIDFLSQVGGIQQTLAALIRSIHLLDAPAEYDVSYSDPALPFSVFFSIPPSGRVDTIPRLAESILHEAMHLQLSLVEHFVPLVDGVFVGHSPWQAKPRPAQGLLHGLYVFGVIRQVFDLLRAQGGAFDSYLSRRSGEIGAEINMLANFECALTPVGRLLRQRLICAGRNSK